MGCRPSSSKPDSRWRKAVIDIRNKAQIPTAACCIGGPRSAAVGRGHSLAGRIGIAVWRRAATNIGVSTRGRVRSCANDHCIARSCRHRQRSYEGRGEETAGSTVEPRNRTGGKIGASGQSAGVPVVARIATVRFGVVPPHSPTKQIQINSCPGCRNRPASNVCPAHAVEVNPNPLGPYGSDSAASGLLGIRKDYIAWARSSGRRLVPTPIRKSAWVVSVKHDACGAAVNCKVLDRGTAVGDDDGVFGVFT